MLIPYDSNSSRISPTRIELTSGRVANNRVDHDVEVDDDDDDDDLGVRSTCGQPITDVECGHDCCCFQFEVGIRDTNAWLLLRNAKIPV